MLSFCKFQEYRMQVRGDQNMLLMPSQEEKLSMELLFFVLLQYLMTPLSTDTA